jgi:hypothetical protein
MWQLRPGELTRAALDAPTTPGVPPGAAGDCYMVPGAMVVLTTARQHPTPAAYVNEE